MCRSGNSSKQAVPEVLHGQSIKVDMPGEPSILSISRGLRVTAPVFVIDKDGCTMAFAHLQIRTL